MRRTKKSALRIAAWLRYRPGPQAWRCEDCLRSPQLWARRGYCETLDKPVESEIAIGGDAHLGSFNRCPQGIARQNAAWIADVFEAYSLLKRFGLRPEEVETQYLLEVDTQIQAIEAAERRYRDKIAALERAKKNRR